MNQVLLVITITLVALAAVNAIFITWATALDARHSSALARALGATPQQVSAGLSAAQVLPALAGAVLGIPGGIALFEAVDTGDPTIAPLWQLLAVVPGTVPRGRGAYRDSSPPRCPPPRGGGPPIRTRLMLRRFIMGLLRTNTRGAVARLLLLAALAATVAACGGNDGDAGAGSDHDLPAEQQAEFETASEFARCMREHGIEGLPDPQVSGNGFMFVGVPLAPRPSEGWDAAQEACQPVFDDAASPDGDRRRRRRLGADRAGRRLPVLGRLGVQLLGA